MTTKCKYIDDYIAKVRRGPSSKEMLLACDLVESKIKLPNVSLDVRQVEKAKELMERYFKITLYDWEMFVIACEHLVYDDGTLVFSEFLIVMGRGNGKNGFISPNIWYLTTPAHGIRGYNVDIVANSEEQAKVSFNDVYNMLDDTWAKSKKFFTKTKELITNTKTRSYIKFNTSSPKTKDGKRTACIIFDEIHEYENNSQISVYLSAFGKRPHSRSFYITTNGYVRDGVLDDKLRKATEVLNGENTVSRMLPLIYKLNDRKEAEDPKNWVMANPSLPFNPILLQQIEDDWAERDFDEAKRRDLYTKRFNLPTNQTDMAVTDYDNIKATNKPLPDLTGHECVCGVDYAELDDWAAVVLHFRMEGKRYDLCHAWVCKQSKTLHRVKAPWQEWAEKGFITVVDDVSIHPDLLAAWIWENSGKYSIKKIAMDGYRWTLVSDSFRKIGFDPEKKNVHLVRPSDIMKIDPVIQECFKRDLFVWGDYPPLRWGVNNTKRVPSKIKNKTNIDTGNFVYSKIEPKSRKTDTFMALVAAMTIEEELKEVSTIIPSFGAFTF